MGKIGFLFPGQGSQTEAMTKDLYDNFDVVKKVIDELNSAGTVELNKICLSDSDGEVNRTVNAQPAIFASSVATFELLKENDIMPDYVAGLSLGEYSAMYAANCFDLKTGFDVVNNRASFMEVTCQEVEGAMAALIGLDREKVNEVVREFNKDNEVCEVANYNTKGQIVISGTKNAIEKACVKAKELGAKRALPLNVAGPFHSSMFESAANKLAGYIENVDIKEPETALVLNTTGELFSGNIKQHMRNQVMSSVYFEDSIVTMVENGVDTFIEVGPGTALSGFVKKIDRKLNVFNVCDKTSFEKLLEKLKEV